MDASPGQAFTNCYPVILDGAVVGWVETELASVVVDSLRRFKVRRLPRGHLSVPPTLS